MSEKINLEEFAGGVLSEKFTRAFREGLHNMQDVNTGAKDKRGITINITLSQDDRRDDVKVDFAVKTKLASVLPAKTQFFVGKDLDTGVISFEEYGNRNMIRGQMSLPLENEQDDIPNDFGSAEEPKKISDFRKTMSK